jgi:single-strand DNA-binding protein
VADVGLAVNETFKARSGEPQERTCFVDIVAWDRQAEACGKYLKKGAPILVEGRLQLDQWQTEEGQNRSKLKIRAERIRFLGGPRPDNGEPGPKPSEETASVHEDPPGNMPF